MKVLSLDLDNTLIHSRYAPVSYRVPDFVINPNAAGGWTYVSYIRPHTEQLLDFAYKTFDVVGVFTTATEPYAEEVVKAVFKDRPLGFLFSRRHCRDDSISYPSIYGSKMWSNPHYVKNLHRVADVTKASMHEILAVDDQQVYDDITLQLQNLLLINAYEVSDAQPETNDAELLEVISSLQEMINTKGW
jgi:TFIIF-interacting CTD phosphatase-like protein